MGTLDIFEIFYAGLDNSEIRSGNFAFDFIQIFRTRLV